MSEEIFITTASIDPYIRDDFYRSLFSTFLDVSPVEQNPLYGSIRIRSVNDWTLTNWQFGIQRCDRRQNLILQSDIEAYLLILIVKGHFHRTTQKNSVRVEAGDLLLINTAQADSCISSGENTAIYIPRALLEKKLGNYRLPDETIFRAKQPMTQLLTDYVLSLFNVSVDLQDEEEVDSAFDALLSLLAVRLKNGNVQTKQEINPVLKHRILQFIDLNIKNPELCIESLMCRFNISRAHLYRAFEAESGIATIIRDKRLDLAYYQLTRQTSSKTIADIAQEYGFSNFNQFLRAFRLRFGMSPSEAKDQSVGEHSGVLDLTQHFMNFSDST